MNCNTYTGLCFLSCVCFVPVFQLASPRTYCSSRHVQTKGTGQGASSLNKEGARHQAPRLEAPAPFWNRNGSYLALNVVGRGPRRQRSVACGIPALTIFPGPARSETTHDYVRRVWGYAIRAKYHAVIREAFEKFALPARVTSGLCTGTAVRQLPGLSMGREHRLHCVQQCAHPCNRAAPLRPRTLLCSAGWMGSTCCWHCKGLGKRRQQLGHHHHLLSVVLRRSQTTVFSTVSPLNV